MKHGLIILFILLMSSLFFQISIELPAFGNPDSQPSQRISSHYIERGYEETGSPNLVTAVLADYRSFDTLMETSVIFIAGLACSLILGLRKSQ